MKGRTMKHRPIGLLPALGVLATLGMSGGAMAESSTDVTIQNGSRAIPATVVVPDGDGPFAAVVMNHGHGGGRQENGGFGGIAKALADKGILTVRMDFPGSGDSKEPFTQGYLSNMISDSNASLQYVLDNYAVDENRLGIFGYSMGGRIALTIGGTAGNPYRAMGLLAPSADWGQDMMVSFLGGQAEYDRLYAESGGEKGFAEFVTQWGQTQELSRQWFDEMIASKPLETIGAYDGPMIVVSGDKDEVIRANVIADLAVAYPAATAIVVPEADHGYGFYSDQPEVTALVEKTFADFFADALR